MQYSSYLVSILKDCGDLISSVDPFLISFVHRSVVASSLNLPNATIYSFFFALQKKNLLFFFFNSVGLKRFLPTLMPLSSCAFFISSF